MRRIKKNPPPQFFEELENLVDKEVMVYFQSDLGYFHIIGILEKWASLLYGVKNIICKYQHGITTGLVLGRVKFNLKMIGNIKGNKIQLRSARMQELEHRVTALTDLTKNLSNIKYINTININQNMYSFSEAIPNGFPLIHAKLKYNKKDDIFYAGTPDTKNFVNFKPNAVVGVIGIPYSVIHINI